MVKIEKQNKTKQINAFLKCILIYGGITIVAIRGNYRIKRKQQKKAVNGFERNESGNETVLGNG